MKAKYTCPICRKTFEDYGKRVTCSLECRGVWLQAKSKESGLRKAAGELVRHMARRQGIKDAVLAEYALENAVANAREAKP